jgi:hypothetical protein
MLLDQSIYVDTQGHPFAEAGRPPIKVQIGSLTHNLVLRYTYKSLLLLFQPEYQLVFPHASSARFHSR